MLREARLEGVGWIGLMNEDFAASPVTGVHADGFSEQLFYFGDEWMPTWQVETGERYFGSFKAARQWAGVVALGRGNLLLCDLHSPEFVGYNGLGRSFGSDLGVRPRDGAIAVLLRPVAL